MKGKRLLAELLTLALVLTDINMAKASGFDATNKPVAACESVDATGVTTHTSTDGLYTFILNSYNYVTLTRYMGTATDVTVPAKVSDAGGEYIVESLEGTFYNNSTVENITVSEGILNMGLSFSGCQNLKKVMLPSTTAQVLDESFNQSYKLQSIDVAAGGNRFFSRNGVLFYNMDNEFFLETYPEAKEGTSYTIDKDVAGIRPQAFLFQKNLQSVSIPSTIKYVCMRSFDTPVNAMTIYFNPETLDIISNNGNLAGDAFYNLPTGSKIIVKNATMANEMPNHLSNCTGTDIIDLSQNASYQKPATSLSFSSVGTTIHKKLSVGDIDTSLLASYVVTPSDTTDNVKWTSSNTNIATVDSSTGRIEAKTTGDCTITGSIGTAPYNQYFITVTIKVYQAISNVELFCGSSNPTNYTASLGDKKKYISFVTTPNRASNWDKTVWLSSNPSVATVEKDETDKEYAQLTFHSPGTTTITATIDDDGTIYTKSFVLNITKPKVDISKMAASIEPQTYRGTPIEPIPTVTHGTMRLEKGAHYTIEYKNHVNAGTAVATITGIGDYSGTKEIRYTINKANHDMSKVAWTNTNLSYNGSNQSVILTGLPQGVTATYSGNTQRGVGKYSVTATLSYDKANYNAITPIPYKTTWFIRNNQNISFSNKNVSKSTIKVPYGTDDFSLGGTAKTKITYSGGSGKVATVNSKGKISVKGTGYTTITVTAKPTDIYNKKSVTLHIFVTPKKSAITYLQSNKKAELTVKWKRDTTATGYQVQYSTSNQFKGSTTNTVIVGKNKTTAKKAKKLLKGKKYFVRVRAYKTSTVSGSDVRKYGKWSNLQVVKVRKN